MVELSEEKKDIIKKYYVNRYLNIIDINKKDPNKYKEEIENKIDECMTEYKLNGENGRFSEVVGRKCIYFLKREEIKLLSARNIYELCRKSPRFKKNLKMYYKNKNEFNINYYGTMTQEEKDKQIKKINDLTDKFIDRYDFNKSFDSFRTNIINLRNVHNHYLAGINITKPVKEADDKDDIEKFENRFIQKCKGLSSKYLTEEELEIYERALFEYYIDNNFLSNSTIYAKIEIIRERIKSIINQGDKILLNYYNKTGLGFDKLFNNLYNKYSHVCKDALLSINCYTPIKEYLIKEGIYTELILNYIKDYPNTKAQNETSIKNKIVEYVKKENKKKETIIDVEKLRHGTMGEKDNERELMLEKYEYIIDDMIKRNKFYDTEKNVRKELGKKYENIIDTYAKSSINKIPSSYIITRLGQSSKLLNKKTKKKKYEIYKSKITNIKESMTNAYIKYNNLLPSEGYDFKKYMDDVCENYIENGLYNNHEKHFIDAIDLYKKVKL